MQAGVIIYESRHVAHAQYIGTSSEGRKTGALDLIIEYLINDYYAAKPYFDFGISTEDGGRYLNTGLVENKQSYGARAIVHDFYELEIPSDFGGVVYEPFDASGGWKLTLGRELRAAGFEIDWNKVHE